MTKLASVFFLISDSLLWPVMIALLVCLIAAVWRLGSAVRVCVDWRRSAARRRRVADALEKNDLAAAESALEEDGAKRSSTLFNVLRGFFNAKSDPALLEKKLAELQIALAARSAVPRLLMKTGPALGLMGTLIPLGPALVGLATGQLDVLAQNLGIAFATTVVGLAASLLAFFASALERRLTAQAGVLAAFAVERLTAAAMEARDRE